MQHIGIRIEDETGNILKTSEFNFAEIVEVVHKTENFKVKFPWIATVDPYGDTLFNHLQVPYVLEDLAKLSENLDVGLVKKVKDLVIFLKNINEEAHQYV